MAFVRSELFTERPARFFGVIEHRRWRLKSYEICCEKDGLEASVFSDARTALYHYRARAYDAKHGRFLQWDPMGYKASGMSLYDYVRGRVSILVDPTGLSSENPVCQFLRNPVGIEMPDWETVFTAILSDEDSTYIAPGTGVRQIWSVDAFERRWWQRRFRDIYKCKVGCLCVQVWGTRGLMETVTESKPNGSTGAYAEGMVWVFDPAETLRNLPGLDALEEFLLRRVLSALTGTQFEVLQRYKPGSANDAPTPNHSLIGTIFEVSGPPPDTTVGSHPCKLTAPFQDQIFFLGG